MTPHPPSAVRLGVSVAATVDELVEADGVDAVAICTSTDTHVEMIVRAAAAGRHVFCEKPIALDLDRIDAALHDVERAGVALHVGFNRRFDPAHRSVRDAIAKGEIGDVHLLRITSRDPRRRHSPTSRRRAACSSTCRSTTSTWPASSPAARSSTSRRPARPGTRRSPTPATSTPRRSP
ncbi:MAG: Gfo/Idh/MocA family oxidoreductase [Ilumatobacteraceae bacterium]